MTKRKTATRASLNRDWQELQTKTDWMHAPLMADYVNGLVSGRSLHEQGHWAIYARDTHLQPLADRRREDSSAFEKGLSMLSLACGSGHIEHFLIETLEWPIDRFVGLEFDTELLAAARNRFSGLPRCESEFDFFDFNRLGQPSGLYDVVFTCHSIHHAYDLEGLLRFVNGSLKPGGIFIGIDFFGPTRFQLEPDVLKTIEELFRTLPPHLRRNLDQEGIVEESFRRPTIAEVVAADPSESIRSSDLRSLLFSNFPILDLKPMGGTLLRWLLQSRVGNFDSENSSDLCILRLLQFIERQLIELRAIRSDDLFFVLGRSDRL